MDRLRPIEESCNALYIFTEAIKAAGRWIPKSTCYNNNSNNSDFIATRTKSDVSRD